MLLFVTMAHQFSPEIATRRVVLSDSKLSLQFLRFVFLSPSYIFVRSQIKRRFLCSICLFRESLLESKEEEKKFNFSMYIDLMSLLLLCVSYFVTVSDDDEIDYSIKPEFYDSDLDDKDELWMAKKRDGRTSDAVLSCPACFTTVCLECQRHEQYVTQYRAVFVVNCKVDKYRVLQHNSIPSKVGKRMRDSDMKETDSADSERVNTVICSTCSTEIGVVDNEEIYHFFNVIPSEP